MWQVKSDAAAGILLRCKMNVKLQLLHAPACDAYGKDGPPNSTPTRPPLIADDSLQRLLLS